MAEHESSLAVLVDFENMARPGAKGRGDFDIHLILNRLAEKGRVIVKRAYADWSRYRDARHELQNAGLNLIEMPSAREGAKNRADIQMVVDAMEWAYSLSHVDTFVLVSGDSDFSPLVGKLRELNKRVIGVGNRESASDLLIANCDEFIFYDLLAARSGRGGTRSGSAGGGGAGVDPAELLQETLVALQREGVEWPLASVVKDSMRRKYPAFDESDHGYSTFSKMLEDVSAKGGLRIETDPRSGTYRVELSDSLRGATPAPPPPTAVASAPAAAPAQAPAERSADEAGGDRRRRRRGRRSDGGPTPAVDPAEIAEAAEVFEVVVTPTQDADLSGLPPLSEPISYEDMIMLGPELDAEVPKLAEASDTPSSDDAAGAESGGGKPRRRRRRGGGGDATPDEATNAGASTDPATTPSAEEPASEEPGGDEPPASSGGRRRKRRSTGAASQATPDAQAPADAPADVPAIAQAVPADAGSVPDEAASSPAPAPGGRRVRRRSGGAAGTTQDAGQPAEAGAEETPAAATAAADAPATEETPVPEEKPKRRRASARAKAQPAGDQEPAEPAADAPGTEETPAADEKPKRRRASTRKKAEPAAEQEPADASAAADAPADGENPGEEKPKRRRAAPRKKAEPAAPDAPAEATSSDDAETSAADEKPKRRRAAPRKKAEPAAADAPAEATTSDAESPAAEEKPKRRRAPRKKAAPATDGDSSEG